MKLIIGDRQTGKTASLIRLADVLLPGGRYIVCHNQQAAYHTCRLANRMGIDINFPISYGELPVRYGSRITHLLIDNLSMFLSHVCGRGVYVASCDVTEAELEILPSLEKPKSLGSVPNGKGGRYEY